VFLYNFYYILRFTFCCCTFTFSVTYVSVSLQLNQHRLSQWYSCSHCGSFDQRYLSNIPKKRQRKVTSNESVKQQNQLNIGASSQGAQADDEDLSRGENVTFGVQDKSSTEVSPEFESSFMVASEEDFDSKGVKDRKSRTRESSR